VLDSIGDDSEGDLGDYDDGNDDFGDDDDDAQIVGDGEDDGSKGGKNARRKRMRERQDLVDMRRERNRILARKTRLRKKLFFESLQHQAQQLASENEMLKDIVKNRIDSKIRALLLPEMGGDANGSSSSSSSSSSGGGSDGGITDGGSSAIGGAAVGSASISIPTAASSFPAPKHEAASSAHNSSIIGVGGMKGGGGGGGGGGVKVLGREDYTLIASIQAAQRSFVITDPSLPDNPIIFASQGFLDLSGYALEEVLGRNCRFMQVANTDQSQVQLLREGIQRGEDVSVCLLNARADGTEFYNQIFVAALRDANNNIANYVGVQVEVSLRPFSPKSLSSIPRKLTTLHLYLNFIRSSLRCPALLPQRTRLRPTGTALEAAEAKRDSLEGKSLKTQPSPKRVPRAAARDSRAATARRISRPTRTMHQIQAPPFKSRQQPWPSLRLRRATLRLPTMPTRSRSEHGGEGEKRVSLNFVHTIVVHSSAQ